MTAVDAYDILGNAVSASGATYPVSCTYNTAGRMTTLATTRDGAAWDTTQWLTDRATGLVTNKAYTDGSRIGYTYTPEALAEPLRTARPPSLPFRKPAVLGESGGFAASRTDFWRGFARASPDGKLLRTSTRSMVSTRVGQLLALTAMSTTT